MRWRQRLAEHVDGYEEPGRRILAVFEWLGQWFAEPGFRGCAWINSYGELGATSPRVVAQVRGHKGAFKDYLGGLVTDSGLPGALTDQLFLLAEGAMVTAGITRSTAPPSRRPTRHGHSSRPSGDRADARRGGRARAGRSPSSDLGARRVVLGVRRVVLRSRRVLLSSRRR